MEVFNLTIRNLSQDDYIPYLNFAKDIINEGEFILTHIDDFTYTEDEEREWIKTVLKNENNICLVAEIQHEIVGCINILQMEGKKSSHIGELSISVHKKYRNKGIGKKLLKSALLEIKNRKNIKKIILQVFDNNNRAIHLYTSSGFRQEGFLIDHVCVGDNKYVGLILMSLFNNI